MHPEVEEYLAKSKKKWKPYQIAMFEDIKQAFPNKSIDWGLIVILKYLQPDIKLEDVDRGVEVWMEMDVVKKIPPIVEKYGLGKPEQRTTLAMIATENAVKNEMREEFYARIAEMEKNLKQQNATQMHIQSNKATRRDFWNQYAMKYIDPKLLTNNQSSENATSTTPRRSGRPSKAFEDFLYTNAPENLMPVLEEMMEGASGRRVLEIKLAITGVYMDAPTVASICRRFNTVGENAIGEEKAKAMGGTWGKKDYSDNPSYIEEEDLERIRQEIRVKLDERDQETTV